MGRLGRLDGLDVDGDLVVGDARLERPADRKLSASSRNERSGRGCLAENVGREGAATDGRSAAEGDDLGDAVLTGKPGTYWMTDRLPTDARSNSGCPRWFLWMP